jgi:hypothetical protein
MAGCSDENGEGGSGGMAGTGGVGGDPFPGNCFNQGLGGGAPELLPGLYRAEWDDESATYDACVYVNEDCTELEASTECNIGEDDSQAHFLELEWTDGRDELGGVCTARVSVTPDLVTKVPIDRGCYEYYCTGFRIEFSDAEGADWLISGGWYYDILRVYAERATGDVVCRSHAGYPEDSYCLFAGGTEERLCLLNERRITTKAALLRRGGVEVQP